MTTRELAMLEEIDKLLVEWLELKEVVRKHFLADTLKKHEETRDEILKLCELNEKDFDF